VYPDCDQNKTCDIPQGGSTSNTVEWTAASGVDYLILMSLSESYAVTNIRDFLLEILGNNNFCEEAQPIVSGDADIVASVENATEQEVILCEDVNPITSSQPGVWYKVSGVRGRMILFMILIHMMLTSRFLPLYTVLAS
jgi:hypothetical protein